MNQYQLKQGENLTVTVVPNTPPPPVDTSGTTVLPWVEYGNSRTIVSNCNPQGDDRKFSFTVPVDAHSAHSISGSDYAPGQNNFREVVLKDTPDLATIFRTRSTAIQLAFSFTPKFGYITIAKGKTYILKIKSDPTPGSSCSYYIDLNNTAQ